MKKTSRRDFGKKLTVAIGAIPVVSLAGKTAKGQAKKKFTGDPITVGGGGGTVGSGGGRPVTPRPPYCEFDHVKYTSGDSGDKKTFKHTAQTTYMTSLEVMINGDTYNLTPFLPANGECIIKVFCQDNESFEITGHNRMRVKLHTRKYPANGDVHQSEDTTNYINRIVVDTPRGWFERVGLVLGDEVRIYADTNDTLRKGGV